MSLPALPDIFGNYVLGDFNEVVSPPAIDWLPQTPGWYLVAAALLVILGRRLARRARHWYHNRYRSEALRRLRAAENAENAVVEINRLLKLAAMEAFPREQVASLSGTAWTGFLNSQCDSPPFDEHECKLLEDTVYRTASVDADARSRLLRASLDWVTQHKNRFDD